MAVVGVAVWLTVRRPPTPERLAQPGGTAVKMMEAGTVYGLAFSPDGTMLSASSGSGYGWVWWWVRRRAGLSVPLPGAGNDLRILRVSDSKTVRRFKIQRGMADWPRSFTWTRRRCSPRRPANGLGLRPGAGCAPGIPAE